MTRNSRLTALLSRSSNARLRANRRKAESRRLMLENLEGRCVLSSISGIVFDDTNGNGSQDGGELPLVGITVFHETDGNSILDAGEDSAVTGADGTYQFNFAGPTGTYHYGSAIIPAGESTGRWVNTNNNYQGVPIETGATVDAVMNFGFRFVPYAGNFYPAGGESLVNTTTAGLQGTGLDQFFNASGVAADGSGNYVVSWITPNVNLQDQIYARAYNADGSARTDEILVATKTRSAGEIATMPLVSMAADGSRFAVAWTSYSASTATRAPFVRTYDGTGAPVTSVVQVSAFNSKETNIATGIAMDGNGDFAVLMTGSATKGNTTNGGITQFQRFTRSGAATGNRTKVVDANLINGKQAIAMDGAGNFVVVYQEATSGTVGGIYAQRYTAAGAKTGSLITVVSDAPSPAANNRSPSVAMNSSGKFVVAWTGDVYSGLSNKNETVQVFSAAGVPIGGRVVLGGGAGDICPAVTIDNAGNVTAAWRVIPEWNGLSTTNTENKINEVRVRRLNADGTLSETFIVNTTTEGSQTQPSIAATGNDGFVVQWDGRGAGDDAGIFTQRYTTTPPPEAPAGSSSLDAGSVDFLMSGDTTKKR